MYLQQYHYHYDGFLKILKKGLKNYKSYILLVSIIGYYNTLYFKICVLLCFSFFIFLVLDEKIILKLKFSKRIKRNIIVNVVIYLLFYIFLYRYVWLLPLLVLLISFVSFNILYPVELIINKYYINKARNKLKRIKPLVIAITGSAGKTTTKHFLYYLIKEKYYTFITKGSYNTLMGIVRSINEDMDDLTEVAIFECGVGRVRDISDILKVLDVDISVITTIFPQHLESFKSFDELVTEKAKLALTGSVHFGLDGILNNLYTSKCSRQFMRKDL